MMANSGAPSRIFISFSGDCGKQIAIQIKNFIELATGDKSLAYVSVVSNHTGDKWYDKYSEAIKESSLFIGLITADYFESFYASGELAISLTLPNIKYLIFKIGENIKLPKNTVESSHIVEEELGSKLSEKMINDVYENIKFRTISNYNSNANLLELAKIKEELTNIFNEITQSYSGDIHEVRSLISEISKLSVKSIIDNKKLVNEDPMKQNYIETPKEVLTYAKKILKSIAEDGEIKVDLPGFVANFWSDNIMGTAKSSIWTTNLKGTHGRSIDGDLIKIQSAAFNRKVDIIRVFVYDETDVNDIAALQNVTCLQLTEIKREEREITDGIEKPVVKRIKNYLINESDYKSFSNEINILGYQADFMIIDNLYSYLTYPNKHKDDISQGLLKPIIKNVKRKTQQLQASIIAKSKEIKLDDNSGRTDFMNLFEKTPNVNRTIAFFNKYKLSYSLSRNANAYDCVQAKSVRYRNNKFGIPLREEMKTIFGYYKIKNDMHLIVLNLAGDNEIDWDKVKTLFNTDYIRKGEETDKLLKDFKIKFASVNPFLISTVYDTDADINTRYKNLTILYDPSLCEVKNTMLTNAGELSWGIEFNISEVLKVNGPRFVYDKSFIKIP